MEHWIKDGILEFRNIGLNTEKKVLPIILLFQFSSVPKYFSHYTIIPEFHRVFKVLRNPEERGPAFPIRWE